MTYDHCGNNPFEPEPIFNDLPNGVIALQSSMVSAHRSNAVAFPPLPRLAAHFTSAQRFRLGGLDPLQDGVRSISARMSLRHGGILIRPFIA
jgi:hypothetical protein